MASQMAATVKLNWMVLWFVVKLLDRGHIAKVNNLLLIVILSTHLQIHFRQLFFKPRNKQYPKKYTDYDSSFNLLLCLEKEDRTISLYVNECLFVNNTSHGKLAQLTLKAPTIICCRRQLQIRHDISWELSAGRQFSWNIIPYFFHILEKMS